MQVLFPPKVRVALYVIVVLGTATLVPLNLAGLVNDVFMSVWTSVSGAVSLLAAFNVNTKEEL